MRAQPPQIDPRSTEDVVRQTGQLVRDAIPGWNPTEPDMASALIRVFGRMVGHVLDAFNQVPERHFSAFLNLIGAEPRPPQPAQVPLTFFLAEGTSTDALVPARTQVAAMPLEGEKDEVVFETSQELVVTRARAVSFFVHNPIGDFYTDRSPAAGAPEVDRPIEHCLYVAGGALFTLPAGTQVTVSLTAADAAKWSALPIEWAWWDGKDWQPLPEATFASDNQVIRFKAPGAFASQVINGIEARWLRARLASTLADNSRVPSIRNVTLRGETVRTGLVADTAFTNSLPIDQGQDFAPFGQQPKVNDAFYLASAEVFSRGTASIKLAVTRSGQAEALRPTDDPKLAWEVWTGQDWLEVGRSDKAHDVLSAPPAFQFKDGTQAFTRSGTIQFVLPQTMGALTLRGTTSHWIRARLVSGNYGKGITLLTDTDNTVKGLSDDGYRPPILESLKLEYTYAPQQAPLALVTLNDFAFADRAAQNPTGFAPFHRSEKAEPALYLGFAQPFDNVSITLFVDVAPPLPVALLLSDGSRGAPPKVVWEYSGRSGWLPLGAEDQTRAFSQSGLVRFIGPTDFSPRRELGQERCWLRARLVQGGFTVIASVRRILTNTTWALHATTIRDELLGSSTGEAEQDFVLSQAPVLGGQRIEVLEPGVPFADERAAIEELEGSDAVAAVLDANGQPRGAWVRWHAVTDFYGSGARDRHYTFDSLTGRVRFGDGQQGMIPPKGTRNVRASSYRTGGGARGNRPANNVSQLKTALPYVDRVINPLGSTGGADREGLEQFKERGPRILRHGYKAVTAEDFEDLARESSTAVARVKVLTPRFDPLEQAGPDTSETVSEAGQVFLLLVAQGTARRPAAGLGLLQDVERYLRARCASAVRLTLAGPDWVEVSADVRVAPKSREGLDELRAAVSAAIERFLHPLTGGTDGRGWAFGRLPHESDLYPRVSAVDGVDHIRKLVLTYRKAPAMAPVDAVSDATWPLFDEVVARDSLRQVLIFSGLHQVRIASLEEE
ncbi:putative baseplate assembly protein [Pyxidicoccus sp. 3LG]